MDLPRLYRHMARSRAFENAVADLWQQGKISGEMHAGTGEEAVAAGAVSHLRSGDGLALTHRCTPALVARGIPLVPMLREFLGRRDGLGRGQGGHMHVFSREHLVATSGIVGASVPVAAGFALSGKRMRKGAVGLALTGDGAMNQGMLLETLNLAAAWRLPLVVVCIDNGWAITTRAGTVTSGRLVDRVAAFGWRVEGVDGTDVEAVHAVAGRLIDESRRGRGPGFLHATCPRIDGHFLGDPLLDQARHLTGSSAQETLGRVVSAAMQSGGGGAAAKAASMAKMMSTLAQARMGTTRDSRRDPLSRAAKALRAANEDPTRIDREVRAEVLDAVRAALEEPEREATHA